MTSPASGWRLVLMIATVLVADGAARGDEKSASRGHGSEAGSPDAGVKPAPVGDSKAESKNNKTSAGASSTTPLPPSLTASALRNELARSGQEGNALSDQHRLETLAAELVKAREALRAETARLEALLRASGAMAPGATPGRDGPGVPAGEPIQGGTPSRPDSRRAYGQLEVIAKAFRGMKPEQAAAVIGQLDRALAAEVLLRMRPADAGAVLGFLRPELGAALATEIARQPAPSKPKASAGGAP